MKWKAEHPENANGWWVIFDENGVELGSFDGGFYEDEALLIAAAPDLLAAAKKALDECCDLIGTEAGNALANAIKSAQGA